MFTIDASAVAAWLLPDEASAAADQLYAQALRDDGTFQAPALLAWETGNLLRSACLRKRISPKLMAEALRLFQKAGIRLESAPDGLCMQRTLELAGTHGLSFYDASYLEQALRTGAQLATKDGSLRRQATKAGVVCVAI